jgi:hypothetical protein
MNARSFDAACFVGLLVVASIGPVRATTLHVGPGQTLRLPSEAASIAHDGDTIAIDAGEYFDCAIVSANNLIISGNGPGTVLSVRPETLRVI